MASERMTFLCEALDAGSKVDRAAGIIHDVKVLGEKAPSKGGLPRGRRYELAAIREAVPQYEGKPVHLNHNGGEGEKKKARIVEDTFGVLRNVRFDESKRGAYADLHYNTQHPRAGQIAEQAEKFPHTLGMSHIADGAYVNVSGEQVISKIIAVECVDIVRSPATTKSLYESEGDSPTDATGVLSMNLAEAKLADIRTARPELVIELTESIKAELAESSEVSELKAKLAESEKNLDAANAKIALADRKALIESKLTAAALPAVVVTETFRAQLLEAKDDAALDALIADRKAIAGAVKGNKPASKVQTVIESKGVEDGTKSLAEMDAKEAAKAFRG
ncbi:MAG: hypothetical protein KF805_12495 [Phycisphaeraceae bacterium]|nr:hypothetical protein [Phycisphaeraceae bacterium]